MRSPDDFSMRQLAPCPGGTFYLVRPGDTMWNIAKRAGVSVELLESVNPQIPDWSRITIGQRVFIPGAGGAVYVVKTGDTAYEIARRYGITLDQLKASNPNININRIEIGQRICLPVAAKTPTAPTYPVPRPMVPSVPAQPPAKTSPSEASPKRPGLHWPWRPKP